MKTAVIEVVNRGCLNGAPDLKIIGNYLEAEMESLNDFLNLVVYAILFLGGY